MISFVTQSDMVAYPCGQTVFGSDHLAVWVSNLYRFQTPDNHVILRVTLG
jgi:hypothetical protein